MAYIAKVTAGGNSNMLVGSTLYGNCTTAAGTAAKAVTITGFDTLVVGVTIHVRFANSNTASSPTLNVSSTGAKPIYKYGTTVPGTTAATSWQAGTVVSLTYDTNATSSGCWVMNDHLDDSNTAYTAGTGISLSSTTFSLATSGVTAGSYGPSANATPNPGVTFNVPYVTVDTYGRVTAASTKTVKMPDYADNVKHGIINVVTAISAGGIGAFSPESNGYVPLAANVEISLNWPILYFPAASGTGNVSTGYLVYSDATSPATSMTIGQMTWMRLLLTSEVDRTAIYISTVKTVADTKTNPYIYIPLGVASVSNKITFNPAQYGSVLINQPGYIVG